MVACSYGGPFPRSSLITCRSVSMSQVHAVPVHASRRHSVIIWVQIGHVKTVHEIAQVCRELGASLNDLKAQLGKDTIPII